MGKNEFIQRAIIAQMANPYSWGSDNNPFRRSFSDIIEEARDMADFVEQEGIPFDALPMNDGYVRTPLGNFRLSVDKEEPEEIELNESNILDTFTKKHPLRVTSEFHMIPECFEEIFNATRDGLFRSCQCDGKEVSATIAHGGPYPIITNWYDVENEKAPNGSWVIFGIPHTSSTPLMVFVLDDQWREDLFREGRAVRVTPNTKP